MGTAEDPVSLTASTVKVLPDPRPSPGFPGGLGSAIRSLLAGSDGCACLVERLPRTESCSHPILFGEPIENRGISAAFLLAENPETERSRGFSVTASWRGRLRPSGRAARILWFERERPGSGGKRHGSHRGPKRGPKTL